MIEVLKANILELTRIIAEHQLRFVRLYANGWSSDLADIEIELAQTVPGPTGVEQYHIQATEIDAIVRPGGTSLRSNLRDLMEETARQLYDIKEPNGFSFGDDGGHVVLLWTATAGWFYEVAMNVTHVDMLESRAAKTTVELLTSIDTDL